MQSIVALLLAHIIAPIFTIEQSVNWSILTVVLATILFCNAYITWHKAMDMLEFQAYRNHGRNDNILVESAIITHEPVANKLQGAESIDDPNLSD